MNRNLLWRGLLILAITVAAVLLAYPPDEKINLGLDLQGGMHLVLQVHTEDALRAETDADMARFLDIARDEGVTGINGRRTGDAAFAVSGPPAAREKLADLNDRYLSNRWELSRRGEELVFKMISLAESEVRNGAVSQAVQTLRNRVDLFGVAEPTITPTTTGHRIVIQLPGVDDPERVRKMIKSTAFLEFRIVKFPQGGGGVGSREEILAHFNGRLPGDVEILEGDRLDENRNVIGKLYYAVEKRRTVTGRDLSNARPGQGQVGQPIVEFTLKPQSAEAFGNLTGNNVGSGLAIVLDGRVVSAPVINSRITDRGQIEGSFTQQEVDDLSKVLRAGALPAGITYLEERTVGPSLGKDAIESGLKAGLFGTALVVLYMLVVYKLTGFNAVLALALNVVLLFGALAPRATLTLPGIAGIILTIGMAVDANVLVFERIREELRAGRTVRSSIDLGFQKALSSIVDSNVTTLIAAAFLFQFGTGPIRGFAVTLFIGLLASMFTAVFVSRWMFDVLLSRLRLQRLSI